MIFIDLLKDKGCIYIFERNKKNLLLKNIVHFDKSLSEIKEKISADIKETYLSLPLSMLNFRILDLPFSDINRIREVLPFEMDSLIIGGSSNVIFDAVVLGETNGKHKVLVTYIKKDVLRTALEEMKQIDIEPRVITSVELSNAMDLSSSEGELANRLLDPEDISEKDRIDYAIREINHPSINLGKNEFSYTADRKRTEKALKITAVLVTVLFVILLSDLALRIISAKKEISLLRNDMRKAYMNIFPNEKKITSEIYQIKSHLKDLREREKLIVGISPLKLLLNLSNISISGLSFSEIAMDKERVVLKGECLSLADVQKAKGELERFFKDVNISDAKPSLKDKTVFTITARLTDE